MNDDTIMRVAQQLNMLRAELTHRVADTLVVALPPVGIAENAPNAQDLHHQRMAATAARFHELLQTGATIDWGVVTHDFAWTERVLGRMGITWAHQCTMIGTYFATAHSLHNWNDDERAALLSLADQVYALGQAVYEQTAP